VLEDVCDRLSDDDQVDAGEISVSVANGEVTLEGTVVDRYSKHRAEQVAASVRGVLDVHNRLSAHKGLLRELGDKLSGDASDEHHGHHGSGTRVMPDAP
jgi:BON domain